METEEDGLEQLSGYLDQLGLASGWLVLFDMRKVPSWEDKLTRREVTRGNKTICVVGC